LAFAIARGISGVIEEKLKAIGGVGGTCQLPKNRRGSVAGLRIRQYGEILIIIRTGVIAGIVERNTVITQIDAQALVGQDGIAEQSVTNAGGGSERDPVSAVEINFVATAIARSAY